MTEPQGTPLTDAAALDCCGSSENDADGGKALVTADFARALERTIAGLREELREAGYNYEGAMSDRRMWRERCETAERQLEAQTLFHKELREFHNACIVDMYEMLGIDGSEWNDGFKAGIEAAAKVCEQCSTGVAVEISGELHALGSMLHDSAQAHKATALVLAATIRAALKRPEAKPTDDILLEIQH